MRKLSKQEWEHQVAAVRRDLMQYADIGALHEDQVGHNAVWCVKHGITARQFVALIWLVAEEEVMRLGHQELQVLHALGQGPQSPEGADDDLPF